MKFVRCRGFLCAPKYGIYFYTHCLHILCEKIENRDKRMVENETQSSTLY